MNHPNPTSSVTHRPWDRWRRSATLLGCALALASCGGTELLVVPLFLFGFTDAPNQVSVFFNPDQPTVATGTFTSVNFQVGADGGTSVSGSGTWSGCTVVLSVAGNPAAPIANGYRGAFINRDTIQLTPDPAQAGRPVLSVQRGGTAPTAPNCP